MNRYLDIAPEVQEALANGKPVVALESTIISHGMPYPQNVKTALQVEKIIRENGAVPATIAVIGGRMKAGLTEEELNGVTPPIGISIQAETPAEIAISIAAQLIAHRAERNNR